MPTFFQGPLASNVAIVTDEGKPTLEFMRKWQLQVAVNGTITTFETTAEVSAVLDLITASPGSLLRRGASEWEGMASAGDATKFLNGDTTPTYAQVKDSDLSTTDITTNNTTSAKHGFAPKSPADATKFLNGDTTPAYAQVKDSDLSTTDITTNNVSTAKHGFTPKLPNDATMFLNGVGAYAVPPGTAVAAWGSITGTLSAQTDLITFLGATYQPLDSDLTTIAGLTATTNNFMQSVSSAWASRTPTQATATLDVFTSALKGLAPASGGGTANFLRADGTWAAAGGGGTWGSITGTLSAQTDLQTALDARQPLDSDLTTIAGLTATTDSFMQAKAGAWSARTIAQVKVDLLTAVPRVISGTSDTPTTADAAGYLRCTSGSATTVTIPPNSSQAFEVGATMVIEQAGTGIVTVAAGVGVTLNTPRGYYTVAVQFGVIQLKKISTDVWTMLGDLGDPSSSGVGQIVTYGALQADYTLTSTTSSQKAFNFSTNGAATLVAGAYTFEMLWLVDTMSATSGNAQVDLLGAGTATLAKIAYGTSGLDSATAVGVLAALGGTFSNVSLSAVQAAVAGTAVALGVHIIGSFDVTGQGTLIPSIKLTTAAAAVMKTGSYFRCTRVGNSASVAGTWT